MLVIPFWYGLFYEYTAFFAGAILSIFLLVILLQKKQIALYKSIPFYLYTTLILCYLLATLWAVDKEEAWQGFLKFLPAILLFLCLMQLEAKERSLLFTSIPLGGCIMCLLSYLLYWIPAIRPYLYSENGRLIGFFQYSNTFAMYLFIGYLILWNKKDKHKIDYISFLVLLSGVVFSGSRTVFILLVLYTFYKLITLKLSKKKVLLLLLTFAIVMIVVTLVLQLTGNSNVITRLFTISLQESTLLGRMIYNLDGLQLLVQHPLGMGYGGYAWAVNTVQTADYQVKYVHNDILQQGLDAGIVAMGLLLAIGIYGLCSKKLSKPQKEILIVLFLHLCMDFDLQFLSMHFILVMAIFEENAPTKIFSAKSKILPCTATLLLFGTFLYLGIAMMALQTDNLTLAEEMLPSNTKVQVARLQKTNNLTQANAIADTILAQNTYVSEAYSIKAAYAYQHEQWEQMVSYQKQVIALNPYQIQNYEDYILLLSSALENTIQQNQVERTEQLVTYLLQVEELLEQVKQRTNALAYQTVDKPELELKPELQNYLQKIKEE